jgi:hypothetical protein
MQQRQALARAKLLAVRSHLPFLPRYLEEIHPKPVIQIKLTQLCNDICRRAKRSSQALGPLQKALDLASSFARLIILSYKSISCTARGAAKDAGK